MQRTEGLIEDTQLKLSSVISDSLGMSGRAMLEALIAGQRNPVVLAPMARGSMRKKFPRCRRRCADPSAITTRGFWRWCWTTFDRGRQVLCL
jgi:hypothetical protein